MLLFLLREFLQQNNGEYFFKLPTKPVMLRHFTPLHATLRHFAPLCDILRMKRVIRRHLVRAPVLLSAKIELPMETNEKPQDENILLTIYQQQSEILKRMQELEKLNEEMILVRKDVLSFAEAIKYLDLSESHVYKLTAKRKIPHYKQGKLIYFVREELDKWLTKNKIKTREELEMEASFRIRRMRT